MPEPIIIDLKAQGTDEVYQSIKEMSKGISESLQEIYTDLLRVNDGLSKFRALNIGKWVGKDLSGINEYTKSLENLEFDSVGAANSAKVLTDELKEMGIISDKWEPLDVSSALRDNLDNAFKIIDSEFSKGSADLASEFNDMMKGMAKPVEPVKVEPFKMPDNVFDGVTKGATAFSKEIYDAQGKTIGLNRTITETTGLGMRNIVNTTQRWDSANKKWVTTNKQMTIGAKSFRMEALGVMFAGMGVTRMFGGLTQGGIEWLGIGPMLTDAFSLMTYSAIEPFSNSLYGASSAFLNLDEAQKKSMGEFLIAGQIGGMALQTFGSLILALSSMSQLFGDSPIFMGAATTALGLMLGKVSDFVSVIPGMEGIGTALETMGGAIAIGGAIKTGVAVKKEVETLLKITSAEGIEGLGSKIEKAAGSSTGKFIIGAAGAMLVYDALINLNSASGTELTTDKVKTAIEGGLGAALITKSLGGDASKMALVGVNAAILFTVASTSDNLSEKMETALVGVGIVAALAAPKPYAIPVSILISGVIMGGKVGAIISGIGAGALMGAPAGPWGAVGGGILGGIGAAIGTGISGLIDKIRGVDDFVLSNGIMYRTNPADMIFGTKNPESLGTNQTINLTVSPTINISGTNTQINERVLAERIGEIVTDKFRNMTNR